MTTHRRRRALPAVTALLAALLVPVLPAVAFADWGATTAAQADAQRRIALGSSHTCAVLDDATVQCWGGNDSGQLGTGSVVTSTRPRKVVGITTAVAVAAGERHSCALLRERTVWCWGLDGSGQVGDGAVSIAPVTTPVPVQGLTGVSALAAGAAFTCALRTDGRVWCWGHDGNGQLGNGDVAGETGTSPLPVQVSGITTATAVVAGDYHACALLADKTVRCWGSAAQGRLGNGEGLGDRSSPVAVTGFPDDTEITALAAGGTHTCAVDDDGAAWCWGDDSEGQLGDGRSRKTVPAGAEPPKALNPVKVHTIGEDDSQVIALTAGGLHSCALLEDRTARCWGSGARSQLAVVPVPDHGDPVTEPRVVAASPVFPLVSIKALNAGGYHTCALQGSALSCWGYDFTGQLGLRNEQAPTPVQTTAVLGATSVTTGNAFACALHIPPGGGDQPSDPRVPECWGDDSVGQLGSVVPDGKSDVPVVVPGLPDATSLEAGNGTTCAQPRSSTGLVCWGRGTDGQLGDGTTADRTAPGPVTISGVTQYDVGGALRAGAERVTTCARLVDATARCWGWNGDGQVGDGTTTSRSLPVSVRRFDDDPDTDPDPVLTGVKSVAAGGDHSCAVVDTATLTGTVWCWGEGGNGQLGNDDDEDHPTAVRAVGITGALQVVAGRSHTCVRVYSYVGCWGLGSAGQLGSGSSASADTVELVQLPDPFADPKQRPVELAAGDDHTCARMAGGDVWCWGDDSDGQVGDAGSSGGDTPQRAVDSPDEAVLTTGISAGRRNTCAAYVDLSVWCWGDNSRDQIGDGIGNASAVPRTLLSLTDTIGTNAAPTPADDAATVAPGGSVVVDVLANDTDPDTAPSTLTVVLVSDATRGTATLSSGTVSYAPKADTCETGKTDAFSYTVQDPDGARATAVVNVALSCPNKNPVAGNDLVTVVEDGSKPVAVLANDSDPDGNPLTAALVTPPAHGSLALAPDGTGTYVPATDYCGPDSATYTASDALGGSDTATVSITVTCVQDSPRTADDTVATPEDTPVDVPVLANDSDPDVGDVLQLSEVGVPQHGTAVRSGDVARYTPATDYCGADSFTYRAGDGTRTTTATVSVTVVCSPDAPRAYDDTGTTTEDVPVDLDVLANDRDPDGDPLTLVSVTGAQHATVTVVGNKARFAPDADFCGADTFGYTVKDTDGNLASAVVTGVAVVCQQDVPRPLADAVQTPEDVVGTFDVLANDRDPDGDSLQVSGVSGALHGTATVAGNKVRYAPAANWCGSEDLTYAVTDGRPSGTASAALSVTVACVNDAPTIAAAGPFSTPWGDLLQVALSADDVDGDTLAWELVGPPAGASISAFGVLSWTPSSDQVGPRSLTVRVRDAAAGATRTVSVTVQKRATTTTWTGPSTGVWSDLVAGSGRVVDTATGVPVAALPVSLRAGSAPVVTATTGDQGHAAAPTPVSGTVGPTTAQAAFAGDAAYLASAGTAPFTVLPESAVVRVTGRHLTTTSTTAGDVTLTATVTEDQDGRYGGGLGVTSVTFTTLPDGRSCTASVVSTPSGTGTASCTLANLPLMSRAVVAVLGATTYQAEADVTAAAVAAPVSGGAAGAGEVGTGQDRPSFAFAAKPDRKAGPSGDAVQVWRTTADLGNGLRPYALVARGTSVSSLSTSCTSGKTRSCGTALVVGGTLTAVDLATGGPVAVPGAATLRVWATDAGEPPAADRYAVAVDGPVPFSLGSSGSQQLLSRGDVRVP